MKYPGNISEVAALQPDYMGFIFYPRSPRFVGNELIADVPEHIIRTGVFVDESAEKIKELIGRYRLGTVQLHGSEDPDFCADLKDRVLVIKAFGVDEHFDFGKLASFARKVDYFLFDTKTAGHGGSGKTFDWVVLNRYQLDIPFFLSGGLSPDNIGEVMKITHPQFYGVDLNSRFETEPGLKNIDQLKKAFELIR